MYYISLKKSRPRVYAWSPTAQDMFQPMPVRRYQSYTELLYYGIRTMAATPAYGSSGLSCGTKLTWGRQRWLENRATHYDHHATKAQKVAIQGLEMCDTKTAKHLACSTCRVQHYNDQSHGWNLASIGCPPVWLLESPFPEQHSVAAHCKIHPVCKCRDECNTSQAKNGADI